MDELRVQRRENSPTLTGVYLSRPFGNLQVGGFAIFTGKAFEGATLAFERALLAFNSI